MKGQVSTTTGGTSETLRARLKRYKFLYLLMIPGALWFILFHIVPLYGIVMAFQDYSLASGSNIFNNEWVGFDNFVWLFSSPDFFKVLWNTVYMSLLKLVCGFFAPIILALMINAVQCAPYKKTVQTISYLPNFLSWVIVFSIFTVIFDNYIGILKQVSDMLGLGYDNPMTNEATVIGFLVLSAVWKGVGYSAIIYLAALSGIEPQLYEAARVDGASKWQQLRFITIPGIMPTCAIVLILNVGGILGGDFEQIFLIQGTNQAIIDKTENFATYSYKVGLRGFEYSKTTALGIFQSAFGAILTLTTNKLAGKLGYQGIW
ncbi:MAG: ABC transporter permease [Christensenellales bacterium]